MKPVTFQLVSAAMLAACAGVCPPAWGEILTATLVQDGFVASNAPTASYSNFTDSGVGLLWVRNHSSVSRLALAQFTLPQLPAGMTAADVIHADLEGTIARNFDSNQELEVLVLATNPNLNTVTYNDMLAADVITGLTGNYNFTYGSGAMLLDTWTGLPLAPATGQPHYHRAVYTDETSGDGLLYWVQQTISAAEPTTLTLAFGPRGNAATTDFRFWSMEGAASALNSPPAGADPAIPLTLTLTLVPEPSTALLGFLALVGSVAFLPRRRRKESTR